MSFALLLKAPKSDQLLNAESFMTFLDINFNVSVWSMYVSHIEMFYGMS